MKQRKSTFVRPKKRSVLRNYDAKNLEIARSMKGLVA